MPNSTHTRTANMKFRTNGSILSPITGAATVARKISSHVLAPRNEIAEVVGAMPVGGVADFSVKDVADAGGKTSIFVERIA